MLHLEIDGANSSSSETNKVSSVRALFDGKKMAGMLREQIFPSLVAEDISLWQQTIYCHGNMEMFAKGFHKH